MKLYSKFLAMILALCLFCGLSVTASAVTFTDAHGNVIELDDSLEAYTDAVLYGAEDAARRGETNLGDLYAEAFRSAVGADIGYINGGIILGEIGDIHRFSRPGKLLAYAGLDPVVYQSGKFTATRTRMSKRGSRALRFALMNAAHNVVKNNKPFHDLYEKKRAEGRKHYNALGHCAGKLVRVIFKMMTDEVAFDLE
jgi:hypothetical protein